MTTTKTVPSTKTETTILTAHDIYLDTVGNEEDMSKNERDACKGYSREVRKNLENGDGPFDATMKAARMIIAKCKRLGYFEEAEIRMVEHLLEAQVRAVKPKPAKRHETVESAMAKFRRARDNNISNGREPFEATRRAANWVWGIDIRDQLATDEERAELERLLDAEVQAVKPVRKDTRPPVSWTDPATTTKAQQKPRPSSHTPRSEPLDIRRAPEPELKQTTSPIIRLEQEIKAHKAEIKEFEREIRDGERISDEESQKKLEELKTRLQEAEAEHARLLAEARAKKEALKTAGKKAPKEAEAEAEAARKKAEEKAARDAAKAASKGKHGGRRAA